MTERPAAYTGPYPIRSHRTMAQVMADEARHCSVDGCPYPAGSRCTMAMCPGGPFANPKNNCGGEPANRHRSTAAHALPSVDHESLNRPGAQYDHGA